MRDTGTPSLILLVAQSLVSNSFLTASGVKPLEGLILGGFAVVASSLSPSVAWWLFVSASADAVSLVPTRSFKRADPFHWLVELSLKLAGDHHVRSLALLERDGGSKFHTVDVRLGRGLERGSGLMEREEVCRWG